ncbi:MAG: hypothetical protein LW832_10740 [Parachlamydia sp.]|jgi:hypothetical protein|nr:hypothetical protein [Parachlamydia sp.]
MNNFLYYNSPIQQLPNYYTNAQFPFISDIETQLPKEIAIIRAVATLAFSFYISYKFAAVPLVSTPLL